VNLVQFGSPFSILSQASLNCLSVILVWFAPSPVGFINGLAEHLRDLLVSKDASTIKLLEKGEALQARYLDQSKKCELPFLIEALELCNECDVQYKTSNNQRLLVELILMRISSINFLSAQKKNLNIS